MVDRATALRMHTVAAAALTGEADVKGTLRPGCFGDLAILSDDYFSAPDEHQRWQAARGDLNPAPRPVPTDPCLEQ